MSLSPSTRRWVEDVTHAAITSLSQYDRANTASVYRLALDTGRDVVLKVYDVDDPYDRRPDRAAHEGIVLDLLDASDIPAPLLLGVDPDGSLAGAPALVMEHMAGTVGLTGSWQEALSDLVVTIHDVDPGPIDWQFEPYNAGCDLTAPAWASDPGLWSEVLSVVQGKGPATRRGFIHRDLHGGNVLWADGAVVSVIDWMGACIGPSALDLSHNRGNIAMDFDLPAADAFLAAYLAKAPGGTWHPHWDLVDAIEFLPYLLGQEAVDRWRWDDRPAEVTRSRFEEYLRAGLVACDQAG